MRGRSNVEFALLFETTVPVSAMLNQIKGLYQVPVDLESDHGGCPNRIHAGFVADMNQAFVCIDEHSNEPEKKDPYFGACLRATQACLRLISDASRRYCLLPRRCETASKIWSYAWLAVCSPGFSSMSSGLPEARAHLLAVATRTSGGDLGSDMNEFLPATDCFTGLALPPGVTMPSLLCLR